MTTHPGVSATEVVVNMIAKALPCRVARPGPGGHHVVRCDDHGDVVPCGCQHGAHWITSTDDLPALDSQPLSIERQYVIERALWVRGIRDGQCRRRVPCPVIRPVATTARLSLCL